MDLKKFDTGTAGNKGVFMQLVPPGMDPLVDEESNEPVGITLRSVHSRDAKRVQHTKTNARLRQAGRKSRKGPQAAELEADAMEVLVAATVEFHHIELEGRPLTAADAEELYTRLPWVYEQVDTFVTDEANFLGE